MAVTQTFTGDANQLNRELDKLSAQYAKLEQQIARATEASDKSAKSHETSAKSAVSSVYNLIAGYVTWTAAIDTVTAAMAKQREMQDKTLDFNVKLGQAQADLLRNAGRDFDSLAKQLEGIQQRTNVGLMPLTAAASAAVSGRPEGLTMPQMSGAIEAAAGMMRERPADVAGFTQSLMQVMGATGITEGRTAAGMLQSIAAVSAIPSAERVGRFAAPGMMAASIVDPQDRARSALEAAAMFSMFTRRGDPTGERSGTATVGMVGGLAEFFEGKQDPGSTLRRIEALQQNEALRTKFLSKPITGVSELMKAPAANIFDPASPEFAMFKSNIAAIQVSPEPYDILMGRIGTATKPLRLAEEERRREAVREQYEMGGGYGTLAARARKLVAEGTEVSPGGGPVPAFMGDQTWQTWAYNRAVDVGGDPVTLGTNVLESRRGRLARGGITPDERPQVQALDKLISELQGLRGDVRQGRSQAMAGAATDQPSRHREN